MKKHLIAAAVATAIAAPAMAQVTMYGAIGASQTETKTGTARGVNSTQTDSLDHWKTTRIGLKGSEDLGGGLKAEFNLEGDLAQGGQLGDADTIFDRQSHVAISGAFGKFAIGRLTDSVKEIEGLGNAINLSDNLFNVTIVGDRIANAYKYATPTINGFKATATYSDSRTDATGGAASSVSGTSIRHSSYAISGAVSGIKLAVGTGTQVTDVVESKTTRMGIDVPVMSGLNIGANYTTNEVGTAELDQFMIQAKYTAGAWEVYATYGDNDATSTNETGVSAKGSGSVFQAIAGYNLSKRTSVYAGYSDFSADGTNSAARDERVTTIGVYHSF
jgi:predicted porin